MSLPTRVTWLTALAVLLTTSSLSRVYQDLGWLLPVTGAVLAVALAGLLSRRLRVPALLQPALGVLAVGLYAAFLYAYDTFSLGLLPTGLTLGLLGTRIGEGLLDVEQLAPPVPTTPGLVLLALLGAGAVAVVADLVAVGLRRPALSGLPLLTLLVVPAATVEGGVGGLPFALGAAGWLALLMADSGERVGRWGTAARSAAARSTRSDDASLGRVGRRIGVAALGTALVVPALLPGLDASLVEGGSGGLGGGSRTTTTYNPFTELAGQLRLPEPRNLLRYTTTDPQPDYLRLTTLDVFDQNAGWSSSALEADVQDDAVSEGIPTPSGSGLADVQPLTTRIRVQNLGGPWLPVPPVPVDVDVDGAWLWEDDSQTVFSTRTDLSRLDSTYTVTAERVLPTADVLRRGGPVPEAVQKLATPPEVSQYVRNLTADIVAGIDNPYEQAVALQDYFRGDNGFRYSEDTSVPGIDAPNALEQFLKGKQGFCQQYAGSMGAMARVLGLPTRVAVGFLPGTRGADGTYQVTTDNAHAWPEIWFAGHGWVRFEPTPRLDQVITPEYSVPSAPASGPDPTSPTAPGETAPALPPAEDPGAVGRDGLLRDPGALPESGPLQEAPSRPWLGPLVALSVLAVLAVPALLARLRRRRRWTEPSPQTAWAQVREDAVDVGHRWRAAESPRAGAARLAAERSLSGAPLEALQRLAASVERARYARPDSGGVAASRLRADVAAVHGGLLAGAPTRARWVARLAPPSTRSWLVHRSGVLVADLLDRSDELVAGVTRRIRRVRVRRPRSA